MSIRDPQASGDIRQGPAGMLRALFARVGKLLMAAERAGLPEPRPEMPDFRPGPSGSAAPGTLATTDTPAAETRTGAAGGIPHRAAGEGRSRSEAGGWAQRETAPARPGSQSVPPVPVVPEAARGQFRPLGQTGNVRLIPAAGPHRTADSPAAAGPGSVAGGSAAGPAEMAGTAGAAEMAEMAERPGSAGPALTAAAPADAELADAGLVGAGSTADQAITDGFADGGWAEAAAIGEMIAAGRAEAGLAAVGEGPVTGPAGASTTAGPDSASLPVASYDSLSLPSLRARLRNLDVAQLRALMEYERANAGREAVLTMFGNRIAKISGGQP